MQGRAILVVVGILFVGLVLHIRNHFLEKSEPAPQQTVTQPAR